MVVTRWSPVRELFSWRNMMERAMDEALRYEDGVSNSNENRQAARLPLDVYSTEEDIIVLASVPGTNPDDVEITVEGETLTIQGELNHRIPDVNYIFSERYTGRFARTLQLNVPIAVDNITADFADGILTLRLPKAEEVRPKVIKVKAAK